MRIGLESRSCHPPHNAMPLPLPLSNVCTALGWMEVCRQLQSWGCSRGLDGGVLETRAEVARSLECIWDGENGNNNRILYCTILYTHRRWLDYKGGGTRISPIRPNKNIKRMWQWRIRERLLCFAISRRGRGWDGLSRWGVGPEDNVGRRGR